jgi:hypothetical protein
MEHVRLMKVSDEVKLLDRGPLAAGAMYRRKCYEEIGGYNEKLKYQEDYDFWIKFVNKFKVHNINLPLLYYRQHDLSMSRNLLGRLEARRWLKNEFVKKHLQHAVGELKIVAIIPARAESRFGQGKLALKHLNGKPLIWRRCYQETRRTRQARCSN